MNFYFIIIIYILIINIVSFIVMGIDKSLARNGKSHSRISEKNLFSLAILLGGIGIFLGMYAFRHKTKHMNFVILIPIIIGINIFSVYFLITYFLSKVS